jgi:hypothetical protein
LTTLFEAAVESSPLPGVAEERPKKQGWLPLLVVLFLFSYGLMTMLIIEQGRTIESQRVLIRELFRDNNTLSTMKKAQSPQPDTSAPADRSTQIPSNQAPSLTAPSTQIPSKKAPSTQAPSKQAKPPYRNPSPKAKSDFQMPSRPASDLADSDRSLVTI